MGVATTRHSPLHHRPEECWRASNLDERCRARGHSELLERVARQTSRLPKPATACRAGPPGFHLPPAPARRRAARRLPRLQRFAQYWDVAIERQRLLPCESAPSFPASRAAPATKPSEPPGGPAGVAGLCKLPPFPPDPIRPGFHTRN